MRISRLYWRIFAWFLAANLATAAATIYLARPLYSAVTARELGLQALAQDAVRLYEDHGRRALGEWLHRNGRERHLHLRLDGPDGRNVLAPRFGAPRPPRAERMPERSVSIDGRRGRYTLHAQLLPGYRLRGGLWLRIAVSVLVLAVLALLLSRWLSRPLRQLTEVTRRMAGGDLSARAVPHIGPRADEIGELAREFDHMAGRLEQGMNNQQRLLRDVSHELRSPLARLEVALELARERGGPAAELDRIGRETGRINALIDQILTLIRLESGQPLQCETIALDELLAQLVADANFLAEQRVSVALGNGAAGLQVDGDPRLLASAIDNVLRNALRHAPDASRVEVDADLRDSQVEIRIRDQGPGVDPAQLEQLFEPFFRASEARERDSGGHGVGLAIVASVMRAHGGEARARNHPDGGLDVSLRLPAGSGG